jgi:hypothetical protein
MPERSKAAPKEEAGWWSALTSRMVMMSLGLVSSQYLIRASHVSSGPASRSPQVVWQSWRVPPERWTWAWSRRMPADRAMVAL